MVALTRGLARRPRLATLLAFLALATLLAPSRSQAQDDQSFLDAYKDGVDAVEAEDWPRAEQLMRTAIAGRTEEADRLIRYFHLRPYIPHFYLGLALAEQGRCQEALASFAESERQGVITGLADELRVLRDRSAACQERLAAEAEARQRRQSVDDLVAQADETAAVLAALADDPALGPGWDRGDPSLADRLKEARNTIARAREHLVGDGSPSDAELAAAVDLARGAIGQLAAIRKETELRREAVTGQRERAVGRIGDLAGTGRELLGSTRELARDAPALARSRSALAQAVDRASKADAELPLAALQELSGLLERRIAEVRAAAAPPPDPLMTAATAWFRGDPRAVLEALPEGQDAEESALSTWDPRARAHALLLRAAAAFALHEEEDDPGGELLDAARRDAATCRRLDPDLAPLPSAFSPRFRVFFSGVEPAPEAAGPGS